ncbi:hypothetical protein KBB96_04015 [Luteolibacter ambystomatis]|uniref:Uncharacterized protein n=1 Tax=Luteolibacter ambystomatis TaxID=2824561 RepID=A0A975PFJ5_9BACT|nr:Ig-like domain-containing protein [Luteolibacter ambystomatis]QUE52059.1 hypothetical protein KBB96_04015 [Luteolibacter ambystomatis]
MKAQPLAHVASLLRAAACGSLLTTIAAANEVPVVALTGPTDGVALQAGTYCKITANASDRDGSIVKVEFSVDGVVIGEATRAPYEVTWNNPRAGSRVVSVQATDNEGAVSRWDYAIVSSQARATDPQWTEGPRKGYQMTLYGQPGTSYQVQYSEDMRTWKTIRTVDVKHDAGIVITDTSAASNDTRRYYRFLAMK